MERYPKKAIESFKTKIEIYLFSKVIKEEGEKITNEDFLSFSVQDNVHMYEQYWQLEKSEKIKNKTVAEIEKLLEDLKSKNSDLINSLKKKYRDEFEKVFPRKEFEKLINQKKCGYCKLGIDDFNNFRKKELIRKKQLTRGWDKLEIDRKYPNLEYTKENTVMSCYWCNNAKTDEFTAEEFEKIAMSIKNVWLERLKK